MKQRRLLLMLVLTLVLSTSIMFTACTPNIGGPSPEEIAAAVKQKIAQLLVEKQAMTDIAHRLSISTSTVIRKLKEFIEELFLRTETFYLRASSCSSR